MNDRPLKAREIEALTFIYPARAHRAAANAARSNLRPWRITVSVTALVLLGALAWILLPA